MARHVGALAYFTILARGQFAGLCCSCPARRIATICRAVSLGSKSAGKEYFERVRAYHSTEPYKKAMRKRSVWVEPLFAEGKQWHGMSRYRLRRLWRVNGEAVIRPAGQNLKRLLKKRGWGSCAWQEGVANALLEFASQDLIHLHALSLAEKALACGEKLHVKGPLKLLPVLGIPLVCAPSLARRCVSSSHEDSTVSRPFWLSSVCLWLARCIFLDMAGIHDRR
jgi:Transposase DDE domain